MIPPADRDVLSEDGAINIVKRVEGEDSRSWEALRVLASIIVRARQGVDSSGEQSLHGAGGPP